MDKKIKMLVIPSDRFGVGFYRSLNPHTFIAEHYKDEFDIDIIYDLPQTDLEAFFSQYDLIHVHKQLDKNCQLANMIKFLGIPLIIDIDDNYNLGTFHPMALTANKEKWHEPIIAHLRLADYITTTTPLFAKQLKKLNKNVFVFPNAIDLSVKQFSTEKTPSDKLRVGIICGSSHLHDIQLLGDLVTGTKDNVQIVLCGFDTNGTRTIYHQDTGEVERRPIEPKESVWYEYEKIITKNYSTLSDAHKDFLSKFMPSVDDPFTDEKYRRMWTRDINRYATHYQNVDVLLAPLKECDFNYVKSQLKVVEAGFTNTAIIAQNYGPYTIDLKPYIGFGGQIDKTGNALLVDTRKNHKDWVKYINKLAENPEWVADLKKNLHDTVKDKYSVEKVCADRVEFYKSIVNKN